MKSFAIIAAAAFTGLVASQDLASIGNDVPNCAFTCITAGLGTTGCKLTDTKCICSNHAFIQGIVSCASKQCNTEDLIKSAAFTKGFCGDFTPTAIIEAALASATGGATPKSSDAAESPTSAANSGKPTQTPAGGAGAMNQPAVVIAGLMAVVGAFAV